jgi:hypothetical protein
MARQRISGLALWAVIEAVSIHIDDFFAVALDCAAERMYNLHGSLSGSVVTPWFGLNGGLGDVARTISRALRPTTSYIQIHESSLLG